MSWHLYRCVPYQVRDELPGDAQGRHPWGGLVPWFQIRAGLDPRLHQRVALHEWIHVVLTFLLLGPLIAAYVLLQLGLVSPMVFVLALVWSLPRLLLKVGPQRLRLEWEALPKGAEVAAGGSLADEAASLSASQAYRHDYGAAYCRQRIAWWAARLSWLA